VGPISDMGYGLWAVVGLTAAVVPLFLAPHEKFALPATRSFR
jgi:hypothetical protein